MENSNKEPLRNIGGGGAAATDASGGGGTAATTATAASYFGIDELTSKIIAYSTSIPSEIEREAGITLIFLFAGNADRNEKQVLQNLINNNIKIRSVYFVDQYHQCRHAYEDQIAEARAKGVAGPLSLILKADSTPTRSVTDLLDNNNIQYYCTDLEELIIGRRGEIQNYTMFIAINPQFIRSDRLDYTKIDTEEDHEKMILQNMIYNILKRWPITVIMQYIPAMWEVPQITEDIAEEYRKLTADEQRKRRKMWLGSVIYNDTRQRQNIYTWRLNMQDNWPGLTLGSCLLYTSPSPRD